MIIFISLLIAINAKWTYIKHELSQGQFVNGSGTINVPIQFPYRQVFIGVDTREEQFTLTVNGIKRKLNSKHQDFLSTTELGVLGYFTTTFREFQDHLNIKYRETSFQNLQIYIEQCDTQYCKSCHRDAEQCDECVNESFRQTDCRCYHYIYKESCVKQCPPQTILIMGDCHDANLTQVQEFAPDTQLQDYNSSKSYNINFTNQSNPSDIRYQVQFDITYIGKYNLHHDGFDYGLIYALVDNKRLQTYSYFEGRTGFENYNHANSSITFHKYLTVKQLDQVHSLDFKSWGNVSFKWQVSNVSIHHLNILTSCDVDHCLSCTQAAECQICKIGFKVYNGNCLNECPINTYFIAQNNTCQDDPIQLILFNLTNPLQDISSIYGNQKDILNPKLIDLIGFQAKMLVKDVNGITSLQMINVQSTLNSLIQQYHYQIRIRFKIILNNQSNFELRTQSNQHYFNESQIVDIFESHTSQELKLQFTCQGSCIIQTYQLVVYKCESGCVKCTQDNCLEKLKCNRGNYANQQQQCSSCRAGCAECTNFDECQRCKDSIEGRLYCN